jgi:2,4-dienoyl-CoA reductase-like NADH-dependent reductase (Old Yellow Enzyme family)
MELDNRMIMAPMTRSRANDEGIQPSYTAEYYHQLRHRHGDTEILVTRL